MVNSSHWWSFDYIETCLANKKYVPKKLLLPYYADKAGLQRPDACMQCGCPGFAYLTRKDLNRPAGPDNLVYLCGSCRGRALKEHNRKPPGRPKLTEAEKLKRAAAKVKLDWKVDYETELQEFYASCRVRTMDDPPFD